MSTLPARHGMRRRGARLVLAHSPLHNGLLRRAVPEPDQAPGQDWLLSQDQE